MNLIINCSNVRIIEINENWKILKAKMYLSKGFLENFTHVSEKNIISSYLSCLEKK